MTQPRKKLEEPFGLITQREWSGLVGRGADLAHIGMFVLLRVRADPDRVTRDTLEALGRWANRSDDTVSNLLSWLAAAGVISSQRKPARGGTRGLTWIYWRKALPLEEWMSPEDVRSSSTYEPRKSTDLIKGMSPEESPDEPREMTGSAPKIAPYNPDVTQIKPQTAGKAFPTGVREGSRDELAKLARCEAILAESQNSGAFAGKSAGILALTKKFPDRDIEQACSDLAEKIFIEYDSQALTILESFIGRARRVQPPEQYVCREHAMVFTDSCCGGAASVVDYYKPGGLYFEPEFWERIKAHVPNVDLGHRPYELGDGDGSG